MKMNGCGSAFLLMCMILLEKEALSEQNETKSISDELLLATSLSVSNANSHSLSSPVTCEGLFNGIASEIEIPKIPANETSLRYCRKISTCCSEKLELKLEKISKGNMEKNATNHIQNLYKVLQAKSANYSESFNDLLNLSKREFHSMFQRTYGIIYEQNAYVFADLFAELEKYYSMGRVDLMKSMDQFFDKLYQKMFTALNAQYSFDERYLTCASENRKNLKPFGDVPEKLSIQIKRTLVATRTFVSSLRIAANILKKITPIRLNIECVAALTRMQQCSLCSGYIQKPCQNYCVNVMKGCLEFLSDLEVEWNNFIIAMDKLAERLLGPFNVVMVVEPINIKISEAIMNFQEAGNIISNKVFQGCGRPKLQKPRNRRTADDIDFFVTAEDTKLLREIREADPRSKFLDFDDIINRRNYNKKTKDKGHNNPNKKNDNNDNKYIMPSLEKAIKEIKQKLKETKKFWSSMPYHLCNNTVLSASTDESSNCWNGNEVGTYNHSLAQNHASNPEFHKKLSTSRQTNIIATEIYYLKIAIENLKKASIGQDVTWAETEKVSSKDKVPVDDDDFDIFSGDSSGGGSGENYEPTTLPAPRHNSNEKSIIYIPSTEKPTSFNPDQSTDNDIKSSEPINTDGTTNKPKKSGASTEMSLEKALFIYLFPIYMTWFSGIFD